MAEPAESMLRLEIVLEGDRDKKNRHYCRVQNSNLRGDNF